MEADVDIPTVEEIEVVRLRLPLSPPLKLGAIELAFRDYVAVRLILSDGAEGYAYGYDRGLPLHQLCLTAAASYLGQPANNRNGLSKGARGATPAPQAAMTRGASLCDIALWDAWCVSKSMPLWEVLGASRQSLPVMPIVGYGMDAEHAAAEAAKLSASGHRMVKCMIDGTDFEKDRRLMEAVSSALPEGVRFGIDAHWSWTHVDQAMPWCRLAERLGASFVEDPFAPVQHRDIADLSKRLSIPLAVGEDVTTLFGLLDLTLAGGILRVDASVSGGITSTIEAIALARAHGRPVLPHVFLGLHAQFGFAYESVSYGEMMAPSVAADPIDQFFLEPPRIEFGNIVASPTPGVGLALDWERLAPFMTDRERLVH